MCKTEMFSDIFANVSRFIFYAAAFKTFSKMFHTGLHVKFFAGQGTDFPWPLKRFFKFQNSVNTIFIFKLCATVLNYFKTFLRYFSDNVFLVRF